MDAPSIFGTKIRHIVLYVTKIKHWIEISRLSKVEFCGNKFRGWLKNFRNFAVCKKSWYLRELNIMIWQKNRETVKFSSRQNFWKKSNVLSRSRPTFYRALFLECCYSSRAFDMLIKLKQPSRRQDVYPDYLRDNFA